MGFLGGGRRNFCTGENLCVLTLLIMIKSTIKKEHLVNIYDLQGSVLIIFTCSNLFNPQNNPMREYYMIS